MSKLWGGRFKEDTDQLTDQFNASINFDKRLYKEDIEGSIAHATMLESIGVLTKEEKYLIVRGLTDILDEIEKGNFTFKEELEDIHMNIEQALTEKIGSAGKKLHTGRSRNDQVASDMMLFVRSACKDIQQELISLIQVLKNKAQENIETYLPGYTHLQRAQPISYAHYALAYIQMFQRDFKRFENIIEDGLSDLPLGSGALAGTTYPLDREFTAHLLDFDRPKQNSLDGVSDRDYAIDFLEACAVVMMHLSRFCEEIILYNSKEFSFITLDDRYTTGSSIMPQKKNPDLAELIRGKTGRTYGNLMALLTTMKSLPLAYNKDMQEDKEPIFDSFDTVLHSLRIFIEMIKTMQINKDKMLEAIKKGFLNATDLADWLVSKDIPFRDAHAIVGELVLYCEENNKDLEDLTLEELKSKNPIFDESVYGAISLENMIENRNLTGGPASSSVYKQLELVSQWLSSIN